MRTLGSEPREARPQGRPASHPIGRRHSLRSNRASDGRQGPEPQAYTAPVIKHDPMPEENEVACKRLERLKQNDPTFFHLNSEPRHRTVRSR
jgi:hypothetical protein